MAALMLAALAPGQATASPGAYRVLIVHSDNNGIPTRLRTQIAAEPDLVALDSFNAQVSTPDAAFLDVCRFKLTIRAPSTRAAAKRKAKGLIVGRVTGTLGGGKRGNLKVKLSSKGLKRLRGARGRKLKVTIAGTSVNRGGKATKVSQKLAVVAKHPKKRH